MNEQSSSKDFNGVKLENGITSLVLAYLSAVRAAQVISDSLVITPGVDVQNGYSKEAEDVLRLIDYLRGDIILFK